MDAQSRNPAGGRVGLTLWGEEFGLGLGLTPTRTDRTQMDTE